MNNTLVSQLADVIAQKLNVEKQLEEEEQADESDDAAIALANLTRVEPEVWKSLPKDVQDVIIKARIEENKAKKEDNKPRESKLKSDKELPRQYSKVKANLTTTSPNEDLIEEYLQQALNQEEDEEDLLANAFCARTVEVSVSEERVINCMNSMVIEANQKLVIMDDGADTSVIGNGWEVIAKTLQEGHMSLVLITGRPLRGTWILYLPALLWISMTSLCCSR